MKTELARVYAGLPLETPQRAWWRLGAAAPTRCTHLGTGESVRVEVKPDWVWLPGQAKPLAVREPARPPIELCLDCLKMLVDREVAGFLGRVIAFEPAERFSRYVFVEQQHLGDVALEAEDLIHCQSLVAEPLGGCQTCAAEARFLWVKRGSTTENTKLTTYRGGRGYYCLRHGAEVLSACLAERVRAPLDLVNLPYGERGVYIPVY